MQWLKKYPTWQCLLVIWILLTLKSAILIACLIHYGIRQIDPFYIWGPSLLAAILLTVYLLLSKNKT